MKKVILFIGISLILVFTSGFGTEKTKVNRALFNTNNLHVVPNEFELNSNSITIPFLGNSFIAFKEALAFKESQGNYLAINTLGYLGKYQFGKSTLERFNIYNSKQFLLNPELQEEAFIALCSLNKWILRKDIKRSVGKTINGIEITESGIIAAAHLAGAGNVKKYLRSNGQESFSDAYGSSVEHYLKKFSGYNTSIIEANRKPVL